MKRNILLNICVLNVLFISFAHAQEIPEIIFDTAIVQEESPDVVIPANEESPDVVIPMEVGIQSFIPEEESPSVVIPAPVFTSVNSSGGIQEESQSVVIPAPVFTSVNSSGGIQSVNIESENSDLEIEKIKVFSTTTVEDSIIKEQTIISESPAVNFLIRNGENILFNSGIEFGTTTITIVDSLGNNHSIPENSVLGVLKKIDDANDNFEISNLQYYDSFGALYLKCIKVLDVEYCDNWQYVVDGFSPWTGIDATLLNGNENVGIYFGSPYQIVFDTTLYSINNPIFVTAQKYNYQNNIWESRTGVTVGLTVTNPLDIWTPIELETKLVGADGRSSFTVATSGDYMIGIKDDWYFPIYSIFVSTTTASTTTSTTTDSSGGGSSKTKIFDVDKAISFLKSLQGSDGSYGGSELYSDWTAIAFASAGIKDSKLLNYLESKNTIKNLLTDNERRAMTLLAMGDNPYNFEGVNYMEAILKKFDGTQFGEKSLINDDIFALIVLSKTGYESSDSEVSKTIQFIISKQKGDGSFENSIDLTSAAIQALNQFKNLSNVSSAISNAKSYLKNEQETGGGWGNVYATSWASQSMYSLGEDWDKGGKKAKDYFDNNQQDDGGVLLKSDSVKNRIWATSYVIPAVLEKSWDDILQSVSKPNIESENLDDSIKNSTSTIPIATSTLEIIEEKATSTLIVAELEKTNIDKIPKAIVKKKIKKPIDIKIEEINNVSSENLASVNQVSWLNSLLDSWWAYVLGLVLIGLGIKIFLKFR